MKSPSPLRHIRYPHSSQLIQHAFNLIAAYTGQTKAALRAHYAEIAQVSPDTIRAWQGGTARPHRPNEIRRLSRDAVQTAHLGPDWLWPFLWAVDAPCALREEILDELRPKLLEVSGAEHLGAYALPFANGNRARVVEAGELDSACPIPERVFSTLSLQHSRPAIVSVGGAAGLDERTLSCLSHFFERTVAPLCQAHQIPVFDGGTDTGVMRAMGQARQRVHATFPLIGVVPTGCACLPEEERPTGRTPLEPNHSHFIFLPGNSWESQALWLSRIATTYSAGAPALTVLADGGEIAAYDVVHSLFAGRPVVAVAGTGRLADQFAEAVRSGSTDARPCTLGYSIHIDDALGFADIAQNILRL